MTIKQISISNVGIYKGEFHIHPAFLDTSVGPITLIGGMNGGGKTSLLDTILLVLYGSRSPSVKENSAPYSKYLQQLVNRDASPEEGAWAELTLLVLDERQTTELRVRRSWKLANVRYTDKVEVWRDGSYDELIADNWDSCVEGLIPSGLATLFFFDAEKITRMAQADQMPEDVCDAISSILGLDLVERLIGDLGRVIRRTNAKVKELSDTKEYEGLVTDYSDLDNKLMKIKKDIASVRSSVSGLEGRIEKCRDDFFRSDGLLFENRAHLEEHRRNINEELVSNKAELITLASGCLPLQLVGDQLAKIREVAVASVKSTEARFSLPQVNKLAIKLEYELENCTDVALKREIRSLIANTIDELSREANGETCIEVSRSVSQQLEGVLDEALVESNRRAEELILRQKKLLEDQERYEARLNHDVDDEKIRCLLGNISRLENEKAELLRQLGCLETEKSSIEYQMKVLSRNIDHIAPTVGKSEDANRVIRWARKAQESFTEFRRLVTARKLDKLTACVTEAFSILTHKATLVNSVTFSPIDMSLTLRDAWGIETIKERLSSGEKQMLAVAVLWGLSRASDKKLPVLIDTPLARLDTSHRANFVLEYLPKASHQVIVLSTDSEIVGTLADRLQPHIGRRYLIEYSDDTRSSRIVEGYF